MRRWSREKDVTIKYRSVDLLWRPVGQMVRFVLVKHPSRGQVMLMSSSLELDALTIIRLYGLRFKIEVSFKQAVHTLGTYAYHRYVQLGCIAQGLLQHLAINFRDVVWASFRSWLRTMREEIHPRSRRV